jgi:ribosomal protein S6E (S10)
LGKGGGDGPAHGDQDARVEDQGRRGVGEDHAMDVGTGHHESAHVHLAVPSRRGAAQVRILVPRNIGFRARRCGFRARRVGFGARRGNTLF